MKIKQPQYNQFAQDMAEDTSTSIPQNIGRISGTKEEWEHLKLAIEKLMKLAEGPFSTPISKVSQPIFLDEENGVILELTID